MEFLFIIMVVQPSKDTQMNLYHIPQMSLKGFLDNQVVMFLHTCGFK